jgi:hypothetical protein
MEAAVRGLVNRDPHALQVSAFTLETILVHPEKDPGCRSNSTDLLRPYLQDVRHALVLFDRDGCGAENTPVNELEDQVEDDLRRNGWDDRARCIVIDPELEVWVWSESPEVGKALGWDRQQAVQHWLRDNGYWEEGAPKPDDPKKAMDDALKKLGEPRSASIFEDLAEVVSLRRCTDPAFQRFLETLREWFPPEWMQQA